MMNDVIFLGKSYQIPIDVLNYLDLLELVESIRTELLSSFAEKLKVSNMSSLDYPDLLNDFNKQAEKIIKKLCENNIFNKTIDEYVTNNKGYEAYLEVIKELISAFASFQIQEFNDFIDNVAIAEQNSTSTITGNGMQVFSDSVITLATASAIEYSILSKQHDKAEESFKKQIQSISKSGESLRLNQETRYIYDTYIPNMETALTMFSYSLLDKYLQDMINNDKFNEIALNYVDIKKSNNLLKNLELVNDKLPVLEQAFITCPFNVEVYLNATNTSIMDIPTFETAKLYKQYDLLIDKITSMIYGNDSTNVTKQVTIIKNYVRSLSIIQENDEKKIWNEFAEQKYMKLIEEYNKIKIMILDVSKCNSIIDNLGDDILNLTPESISSISSSTIKSIISDEDLSTLVNIYDYTNFLSKISPQETSIHFNSKSEIDKFYYDRLNKSLTEYVEQKKEQIIHQKDEAKKAEKAKIEQMKRNDLIIAISLIVIAIVIIASIVGFISELIE